jgi:SHS2 domain-containing protein
MAEEIIDLRDRIEKMRVQIENEGTEQIRENFSNEVYQKTKTSNITLSMQPKKVDANQNHEKVINSKELKIKDNITNENQKKNETFPAVSLSVKNPISNKILVSMFVVQILSNFGILYFLYLGLE